MLTRGSSGDNVTMIQGLLTEAGLYTGRVDGQYGRKTEAAVREWQGWAGLPRTGTWDPQTTLTTAKVLDTFTDPYGRAIVPTVIPAEPMGGA